MLIIRGGRGGRVKVGGGEGGRGKWRPIKSCPNSK